MDYTFLSSLHRSVQLITTTRKASTPLFFNHRGCFIDTYVGWPGRVHDARVFANSSLYRRGQSGSLLPDWKEQINGTDVLLVQLGDPAYLLLPWLAKGYPNKWAPAS